MKSAGRVRPTRRLKSIKMYIIATISKNSYAPEKVEEIIRAGAEVLRYNFSHGSPAEVAEKIMIGRSVIARLGLAGKVKILADLPGSKIRLGNFAEKEHLAEMGQVFLFQSAEHSDDVAQFVPVAFEKIGTLVEPGQVFTLGDGEIAFTVTEVVSENEFRAQTINRGLILNLKGINIGPGIDRLEHLTEKTKEHIKILPQIKPEWVAFSFANSRDYLRRGKTLLDQLGVENWRPQIVSKVESPLGVKNLGEIIDESDVVMVARGDLGLTVPIEQLGLIQKKIIQETKKAGKQVVVATHVLGSLLDYYVPARAEVVDLTQIILDGADGIMLTKETGISLTPGYSVSVAKKIISAVTAAKGLYGN